MKKNIPILETNKYYIKQINNKNHYYFKLKLNICLFNLNFQSYGDKWNFEVPNDEGAKCDFTISQDGIVCIIYIFVCL